MIPGTKVSYSVSGGNVQFRYNKDLPVQGYTLDIMPGKINIGFSSLQGLYYAVISLKVLKQNYSGKIPCVYIEDFPDLAVRGLMLDISRNKVPTKETLLDVAQLLADLKYNHFGIICGRILFCLPLFQESLGRERDTCYRRRDPGIGYFLQGSFY